MFPHATILGPLFWIVMGALYVLIARSAVIWAKDAGLKMNWWKWTLAAIWFIILNMTIAGATTLWGEDEPRAGNYFLGVFGVVCIVAGVGLWRIVVSGRKKGVQEV